jgi:hypothetical protein
MLTDLDTRADVVLGHDLLSGHSDLLSMVSVLLKTPRIGDADRATVNKVDNKRPELLRARLEARDGSATEAPDCDGRQQRRRLAAIETACLQGNSDSWQQAAEPRALMVRKGSPVRVRQRALHRTPWRRSSTMQK